MSLTILEARVPSGSELHCRMPAGIADIQLFCAEGKEAFYKAGASGHAA